jgi:hypothetical protein
MGARKDTGQIVREAVWEDGPLPALEAIETEKDLRS